MDIQKCPFCDHINSGDAKYCSECGGCLHLIPCPACGAVNDVKAAQCYQCHGHMHADAAATDANKLSVAVVDPPKQPDLLMRAAEAGNFDALAPHAPGATSARPQRSGRVVIATALLALLAVVGYRHYLTRDAVNGAPPPAAGGAANADGAPASAGVIRSESAMAGTAAIAGDGGASSVARTGFAPASQDASASPVPTVRKTPAASAKPAASAPPAAQAGDPVVAAGALGIATNVPEAAASPAPRRDAACDEATAALGLCARAPAPPAVTHLSKGN